MKHIVLVPTSHIARESVALVRKTIEKEKPDCVAVELDMNRFVMMESGEASNREALKALGPWTFMFFIILKRVQDWLGKKVGILPGSDMLGAVREAERHGVHVEFIDRNIALTLERLKKVSWREKAKLVFFLGKGITLDALLAKAGKGKQVRVDLNKVPPRELILEIMAVLKREFPGIHRALVSERDHYMARRLAGLVHRYERIVAVVGAGHAPGIQDLLSGKKVIKR